MTNKLATVLLNADCCRNLYFPCVHTNKLCYSFSYQSSSVSCLSFCSHKITLYEAVKQQQIYFSWLHLIDCNLVYWLFKWDCNLSVTEKSCHNGIEIFPCQNTLSFQRHLKDLLATRMKGFSLFCDQFLIYHLLL